MYKNIICMNPLILEMLLKAESCYLAEVVWGDNDRPNWNQSGQAANLLDVT